MKLNPAPCHIRFAVEDDFGRLEAIYRAHEGVTMPDGYFADFQATLRSDSVHYYFVAEADDRVVGGGGISNYTPGGQATLAFGIVDPQLCRRGYGTSLLLARFLFIDPGPGGCVVSLEATEWSADFFARAGFRWYASSQDEHGNRFVSGYHHIPPGDRERFRRAFDDAGLTLCPEVAAAMGHAHVLSGIYAAEGRLTSG